MQAPRSYTSVKVRKTLHTLARVWQSDSAMTEECAAARSALFQGFSGLAQTTGGIDMAGLATQAALTDPTPLAYPPATARIAVTDIGTETQTIRARMLPVIVIVSGTGPGPGGGSTTLSIRRIASPGTVNVSRSKQLRGTEWAACWCTFRTARSKGAVSLATRHCKRVSVDDAIDVRYVIDAVSMPRVEPTALICRAVPHTAHSTQRPTAIAGSCGQPSIFATEKPKWPAAFGPSHGPSTTHP